MNQNNFIFSSFPLMINTISWIFCLIKWYRIQPVSDVKGFSLFVIHLKNCLKWSESCSVVFNFLWPPGLYSPWNSLGQNTGMGSLSFLQGIFPTQEMNQGLLHCRWFLYQLSYQESPQNIQRTCKCKCVIQLRILCTNQLTVV